MIWWWWNVCLYPQICYKMNNKKLEILLVLALKLCTLFEDLEGYQICGLINSSKKKEAIVTKFQVVSNIRIHFCGGLNQSIKRKLYWGILHLKMNWLIYYTLHKSKKYGLKNALKITQRREPLIVNTKNKPSEECMSEKSSLFCGKGTVPGSDKTALKCAMPSNRIKVLNITALKAPHKLECRNLNLRLLLFKYYSHTCCSLTAILSIGWPRSPRKIQQSRWWICRQYRRGLWSTLLRPKLFGVSHFNF